MYSPLSQIAQSFSHWKMLSKKKKKKKIRFFFSFLNKRKEKKKVHHTLKAVIFISIPEILGNSPIFAQHPLFIRSRGSLLAP